MEYLKLSNLLNLIVSPTKIYQKVKQNPDFISLIFLIPFIAAVTMLFRPKVSSEELLEYVKKIAQDPAVQHAALKNMKFTTSPLFIAASTFLSYIISFLVASFVLLIIVRLAGGEIDYKRALTIVAVANLVMIPYYILYTIYARITNLSSLEMKMDFRDFILTYLNVFAIWRYILIGIGIFIVCELNRAKSVVVACVYTVITLIIPIMGTFMSNITKFMGR